MATIHYCDVCGDAMEERRPYDDWTSLVVNFQGEDVIVRMIVSTNNTDHDICESCARSVIRKVVSERLRAAGVDENITPANY